MIMKELTEGADFGVINRSEWANMEFPPMIRIDYHLLPPPLLHSLATSGFLFQFQEMLLFLTASVLLGSLRGEAVGDGEAGPGAGGQQRPDQSVYGLMGSSPLSLGETSLVSVMLGQPCRA